MSKLFYSLAVTLMVLVGITFPYMNNQQLEIRYLGFSGEVNLSVLLLIVLVIGVVAGFVGNLWALFRCRRKLARSRREARSPVPSSRL